MSGSSIPAAIDYLLTLAQQAATAVGVGTIVSDGWPAGIGESMFGVGADRPPETVDGSQAAGLLNYRDLGARTVDETYGVPCYIYSGSGGTSQSTVRLASFALWNAFFPLLRADLTLGGALGNGNNYARISDFGIEGPKSAEEAGSGRYCLLTFTVVCENRY